MEMMRQMPWTMSLMQVLSPSAQCCQRSVLHFIDPKWLNPKLINVVNVVAEICTFAQEFND